MYAVDSVPDVSKHFDFASSSLSSTSGSRLPACRAASPQAVATTGSHPLYPTCTGSPNRGYQT